MSGRYPVREWAQSRALLALKVAATGRHSLSVKFGLIITNVGSGDGTLDIIQPACRLAPCRWPTLMRWGETFYLRT